MGECAQVIFSFQTILCKRLEHQKILVSIGVLEPVTHGYRGMIILITHTFIMKVKVAQSFTTPWTIQSMEFSRPEYWSGQPFPSPGVLPNPGIKHKLKANTYVHFYSMCAHTHTYSKILTGILTCTTLIDDFYCPFYDSYITLMNVLLKINKVFLVIVTNIYKSHSLDFILF